MGNEKDFKDIEEIGSTGLESFPIKIQIKEFNSKPFIDIRRFYTVDKQLKPTGKGLSLNFEQLKAILDILNQNFEKIKQYLREK